MIAKSKMTNYVSKTMWLLIKLNIYFNVFIINIVQYYTEGLKLVNCQIGDDLTLNKAQLFLFKKIMLFLLIVNTSSAPKCWHRLHYR